MSHLIPQALVFHCLIVYPDSRVKETNPYLRDSSLLSLRLSPSMGGGYKVGNVAHCGLCTDLHILQRDMICR
jgi:hypothetical protein